MFFVIPVPIAYIKVVAEATLQRQRGSHILELSLTIGGRPFPEDLSSAEPLILISLMVPKVENKDRTFSPRLSTHVAYTRHTFW